MHDWSEILKKSPINWLLEKTNSSVRYFTLRDVLGKNEEDKEVAAAKQAISESDVVKRIMQKQRPEGYWMSSANPYLPKYKDSYWTLMILAQLGMDNTCQKVEKACEYIFQFQLADGGFTSQSQEASIREYDRHLRKGKSLPHLKIGYHRMFLSNNFRVSLAI
jgi:hypothetical protein